ncbi:MAG: TIGR03809 family protein [Xanthobacteraceae bacterium]
MAQRTDLERGRAIVERWRALAEQRLDYLIALQESGRWQRFHSEPDFLDNLREARDAVETWRLLASREASLDNRPIDFAWLGQGAVPLAQRDIVKRDDCAMTVAPIASPPVAPVIDLPSVADALPLPGQAASLDLATMQSRYPLLRNGL